MVPCGLIITDSYSPANTLSINDSCSNAYLVSSSITTLIFASLVVSVILCEGVESYFRTSSLASIVNLTSSLDMVLKS